VLQVEAAPGILNCGIRRRTAVSTASLPHAHREKGAPVQNGYEADLLPKPV